MPFCWVVLPCAQKIWLLLKNFPESRGPRIERRTVQIDPVVAKTSVIYHVKRFHFKPGGLVDALVVLAMVAIPCHIFAHHLKKATPPEMQEGNSECVRDVWAVKPLCSGPEEPSASDQSQILCVLLRSASKPGIQTHQPPNRRERF